MEKFTALCGFGNAASARANLNRMLAKVAGDQDTNGGASPVKASDGGEATQETPAGKKKGGGRKRSTGKLNSSAGDVIPNSWLTIGIDDAAGDDADASPTKKRASPTKRKGKAAAAGESPIKKEADEGADDDA